MLTGDSSTLENTPLRHLVQTAGSGCWKWSGMLLTPSRRPSRRHCSIKPPTVIRRGSIPEIGRRVRADEVGNRRPSDQVAGGINSVFPAGRGEQDQIQSVGGEEARRDQSKLHASSGWAGCQPVKTTLQV